MATNNDFGLHVALHVKKSNPLLAKEVQDALDNTNRKFHVDLKKVTVTNAVLGELQKRIQGYFDNERRTFRLRIDRIEAQDAINNVRQELAQMVEAFRLDNGVNIRGIGSFTDGAYKAAYQRRIAAAEQAAGAMRDEAAAEEQVLEEAEATTAQLQRQERMLGQVANLHRQIVAFQSENPGISMVETERGVVNIQALDEAILGLGHDIAGANAANVNAMDNFALRLETNRTALNNVRDSVATLALEETEGAEATNAQLQRQERLLGQVASLHREITTFQSRNPGLEMVETERGVINIRELDSAVLQLGRDITSADVTSEEAMSGLSLRLEQHRTSLKSASDGVATLAAEQTEENEVTQQQINSFQQLANTVQSLGGSLNTSEGLAMRLQGSDAQEYLSIIQNLREQVYQLEQAIRDAATSGNADFDSWNERVIQLQSSVKQVNIDLGNMKLTDPSAGDKAAQSASSNLNLLRQIETSAKSASSLLSNNTKLFGTELGTQLQGVIGKYDSLIQRFKDTPPTTKAATDQVVSELNGLKEETASIGLEMERTGLKGNTMMTRFTQGIKKFGGWTIVTRALTAVIRLGRQLVTNVKEIDSAMTQLKIVTSGTSTEISRFGDNIAETAKEIGASITDLVDSATTYARLGYSLDESSVLAKYTSMLKAVGDIEVSDAQDAITAITKAYSDVDINNIESVMDKLVKVGKESCPAA